MSWWLKPGGFPVVIKLGQLLVTDHFLQSCWMILQILMLILFFLKCQFFMVFVGLFIAIQWFMFHEFHVKVLKSLHFPRFFMANSPGPARDYSRVTGAFDRLVKAEDVQMKPGIQSCSMGNPLKLGKREWECFKAKYSLWNGELRVECLKHMIGYVVCNFDEIREAQIG